MGHARTIRLGIFLTLGVAGAATLAKASVSGINDVSFFTSIPHTLIDFETDGLGAPISLVEGQALAMPANAYSPQHVLFSGGPSWVNDGSTVFDLAQSIGGSGDIAIPSSTCNQFTITFAQPTVAMGFWVVNNSTLPVTAPRIDAYDALNNLLGSVEFTSTYIDGEIVGTPTSATYGFMGLFSTTAIDHVIVSKQFAIFDDLRFAAVPSPGSVALLACGAGLLFVKRRR